MTCQCQSETVKRNNNQTVVVHDVCRTCQTETDEQFYARIRQEELNVLYSVEFNLYK